MLEENVYPSLEHIHLLHLFKYLSDLFGHCFTFRPLVDVLKQQLLRTLPIFLALKEPMPYLLLLFLIVIFLSQLGEVILTTTHNIRDHFILINPFIYETASGFSGLRILLLLLLYFLLQLILDITA